jgi:hypothetical protein
MCAFGLPALLAIALAIVCVAWLTRPRNTGFSRSMKPPPVPIGRASMYISSECEKADTNPNESHRVGNRMYWHPVA